MKRIAERIFRETLAALDVREALMRQVIRRGAILEIRCGFTAGPLHDARSGASPINLRDYREIVAIAFGKAAYKMAKALSEVLAPEFHPDGILVVPSSPSHDLPGWQTFVGGHPVPNEESFRAGHAVLERLRHCDEHTLVFFLISGGGSSLIEQPLDPNLSLADFRQLNHALVNCGAPIEDVNVIRKHLSAIKGGRLAAAAPRATQVTLAISDVPIGHEWALASGPTVADPSTVGDAEGIAREHKLLDKFPANIRRIFERNALVETPKEDDPAFERSSFFILLGEHDLVRAACQSAEAAGFIATCDSHTNGWPVDQAADYLLAQLTTQQKASPGKPIAIVADGEVSSPVTGDGVGGRNSAFVLSCVNWLAKHEFPSREVAILSAGTDGIDGNSPAAGALADKATLERARLQGLNVDDSLRRSDSYRFFKKLGDALVTGPTGNNLRDLRILLAR